MLIDWNLESHEIWKETVNFSLTVLFVDINFPKRGWMIVMNRFSHTHMDKWADNFVVWPALPNSGGKGNGDIFLVKMAYNDVFYQMVMPQSWVTPGDLKTVWLLKKFICNKKIEFTTKLTTTAH